MSEQLFAPEPPAILSQTYLYLVRDKETGFIKIGRSNDPTSRLRQLRRQDTLQPKPNDYVLVDAWYACSCIEKQLHNYYAAKNVRGEWFRLTHEDICDIVANLHHYPRLRSSGFSDAESLLRDINDLQLDDNWGPRTDEEWAELGVIRNVAEATTSVN